MLLTVKAFGANFDVEIFNGGDYYEIASIKCSGDLSEVLDGYVRNLVEARVEEWMEEKEDELNAEGNL